MEFMFNWAEILKLILVAKEKERIEKQIENINNVVIIDMLGNLDFKKTIAGVDFKLPLNTESLEFMYEDCLNDATSDSKSMIKDIFQDLSEYSKTVSFLPFGVLKTIVDDMVDTAGTITVTNSNITVRIEKIRDKTSKMPNY